MSIPGGYGDFTAERDENRRIWIDSVEAEASNAKAQLANQRAATDNQYRIGMAQVKNEREKIELQRWYQQEQIKLEQERVEIEQATLELRDRIETGRLDLDTELGRARIELDQGRLGLDTELGRGQLGLKAVETAASMGGPEKYFDYLEYLSGAQKIAGMSNWLGALQSNQQQLGFNAPGAVQPATQTFGGMIEALGGSTAPGAVSGSNGGTGAGTASGTKNDPQAAAAAAVVKTSPPSTTQGYSPDDIKALDIIQGIYGAGAHKMGPGVYESMSPGQKGLFASGGRKSGHDPKEFLYRHEQSRVGQDGSLARLA